MPSILEDLPEIVTVAAASSPADWYAYHCDNGCQKLDRLSLHMDSRYEVQVNRLFHSSGQHCHKCNMLSLILSQGYLWHLRQHGSQKDITLFAAPHSIITMQPEDTHWIPQSTTPSLSLCVFDKQSDWHHYYCEHSPLAIAVRDSMHAEAVKQLLELRAKNLSRLLNG